MQLPSEKKNLTVQEAADELNVRRERVWKLMADGVLTAERSKLDGRQKLIPPGASRSAVVGGGLPAAANRTAVYVPRAGG